MKATVEKKARTTNDAQQHSEEFVAPEVNIFETKDGYVLEAEMPGVNKEGLEIYAGRHRNHDCRPAS
jgi:HSP20 family molecular chaperone IbpA